MVYFSGSCHFLCTLFSLTFCLWPPWLPATPHAASEKTLHHIHVLCNLLAPCSSSSSPPPRLDPPPFLHDLSARHPFLHHVHLCFLLCSHQVFFPPTSFCACLPSPPSSSIPPSRHVKTPASCGLLCGCESLCVSTRAQSFSAHPWLCAVVYFSFSMEDGYQTAY